MTGKEKRNAEKTQPGNPHGLTRKQHVLPARSIERFTRSDGYVSVLLKNRPDHTKSIRVSPDNPLFCADRVWAHGSEISCKNSIEDPFQELAERILSGETTTIGEDDKAIVDSFYGLWDARAYFKANPPIDVSINGVTGIEHKLSKDEQELLEKNNVSYITPDLKFPGRDLASGWIAMRINQYRRELKGLNWSIVRSHEWEFFVPNAPKFHYVPISPTISLIADYAQDQLPKEDVGHINRLLYGLTDSYIFARNFSKCCVLLP